MIQLGTYLILKRGAPGRDAFQPEALITLNLSPSSRPQDVKAEVEPPAGQVTDVRLRLEECRAFERIRGLEIYGHFQGFDPPLYFHGMCDPDSKTPVFIGSLVVTATPDPILPDV